MNSEVTYLLVEPRCFILIVYNPGHSSTLSPPVLSAEYLFVSRDFSDSPLLLP